MGLLGWQQRRQVPSVEGSSVSVTVPESDSTTPAGLVSRGQGEASMFARLCQECRGCQGLGLMSSVLPHLLGG